jgi:uncharacterized membrane protein
MTALMTVVACDALFAIFAVPLMLRKVPPNVIYGYRTRATLTSESLWYEANAHFGRGFLIGSVMSGVAALALYTIHLSAQFVTIAVIALVIPPLIAALATARYIHHLRTS